MYSKRAALYTRLADIMWSRLCPEDKDVMMEIIEEEIAELSRQDPRLRRPSLALVEAVAE